MNKVTDIKTKRKKFFTARRKEVLKEFGENFAKGALIGVAIGTPLLYFTIHQQSKTLETYKRSLLAMEDFLIDNEMLETYLKSLREQ